MIVLFTFLHGHESLLNDQTRRRRFQRVLGGSGRISTGTNFNTRHKMDAKRGQLSQNRLANGRGSRNTAIKHARAGFRGAELGFGLLGRRRGRWSPGAFNMGLGGRFGQYFPNFKVAKDIKLLEEELYYDDLYDAVYYGAEDVFDDLNDLNDLK